LRKEDIKLLSVFCGMSAHGLRVDINSEVNPDVLCDVHVLSKRIDGIFDVIIADPPYSDDESKDLYTTGKLRYKVWTGECTKLLCPGGLLVVYHKYVMPNPDPKIYKVCQRVFIGSRTYHLPRVAIFFKKKG